ncbi:MAG: hypothetical protein ACE5EN_00165 [Nitrospinota bacterium]
MEAVLGLVLITVISYAGSVYIFRKDKLPPKLRYLFYSGWEFILLGLAAGPLALNFFPREVLHSFDPVLNLGLAWVGLLFGTQLRYSDVVRLDKRHLAVTFWQALLTGAAVGVASIPAFYFFSGFPAAVDVSALVVLAASSSLSSPTVLVLLQKETGFRERVIRLLQLMTNLDAVVAVFVVGIVFTIFRPGISATDGALLLFQAALVGILLGFLFYLLPREKLSENEQLVILLGFGFFSAGIGSVLQVSPLFLNMVCGIYLGNTLKKNDAFYSVLFHTEKPIYVVMLILAGLMFRVPEGIWLVVIATAVVVRLGGKYFFVSRLVKKFEPGFHFPENGGLALASQGAMALVIGFSFLNVFHGEIGEALFSAIVACVMINEIIAPYLVSRVFRSE